MVAQSKTSEFYALSTQQNDGISNIFALKHMQSLWFLRIAALDFEEVMCLKTLQMLRITQNIPQNEGSSNIIAF